MRKGLVALLAAAALGGCGEGEQGAAAPRPTPAAKPLGFENQGSVVQYADCGDWKEGSDAEQLATVVALRGQLTPQRSATAESPLTDERAVELLDNACTESYASSLRLYKIYARAQSFSVLGQPAG